MTEDDMTDGLRDKLWETGGELEEIRQNLRERKTERLQLRVTPTEKEEVDMVTELLGVSAADYLMHLHRAAMRDLDRKKERHAKKDEKERKSKSRRQVDVESTRGRRPKHKSASQERREKREARRSPRRRRRGDDEGSAGVTARL